MIPAAIDDREVRQVEAEFRAAVAARRPGSGDERLYAAVKAARSTLDAANERFAREVNAATVPAGLTLRWRGFDISSVKLPETAIIGGYAELVQETPRPGAGRVQMLDVREVARLRPLWGGRWRVTVGYGTRKVETGIGMDLTQAVDRALALDGKLWRSA